MFKSRLFVLAMCLITTSLFAQRNYETFSFLGQTGIVNKQTLEIELEPKYEKISIWSDSDIQLYSKDGKKFKYDATKKTLIENTDESSSGGVTGAFLSDVEKSRNRIYSTKTTKFIVIKGDNKNYLGIEIPGQLNLKSDIGSIELTKNNEPYLDIAYDNDDDTINFYLPKRLEKELNIKTYTYNEAFISQWFSELTRIDKNEVATFIENTAIPLEFIILRINTGPTNDNESYKNFLIDLMVYNEHYETAKGLFSAFYADNMDEFENDAQHDLLISAIDRNDLDFIKSVPQASLKKIRIKGIESYSNLLEHAFFSQNMDIIEYLLSIGLDSNKVRIYKDGKTTSALELLKKPCFNDSRSNIHKLLKK